MKAKNRAHLAEAVLKTLAYHSVFKYALTALEVKRYLVEGFELGQGSIVHELERSRLVAKKGVYFSLQSLSDAFLAESDNRGRAWEYLSRARNLSLRWLVWLPTIRCVAVSGSVAALDAGSESDIDLLIVCRPGTLWLTRALVLAGLSLAGQRVDVRRSVEQNAGWFCPNIFLSTDRLQMSHQDLYVAMEIAHLKVVLNRGQTFQKLLISNPWLRRHLPNFWQLAKQEWGVVNNKASLSESDRPVNRVLLWVDRVAKFIQQNWYQRKFNQNLSLRDDWRVDHRQVTLDKYQAILKPLNAS